MHVLAVFDSDTLVNLRQDIHSSFRFESQDLGNRRLNSSRNRETLAKDGEAGSRRLIQIFRSTQWISGAVTSCAGGIYAKSSFQSNRTSLGWLTELVCALKMNVKSKKI